MYCLEVGAWVDIAFITMCASAIDMLHVRNEDENRIPQIKAHIGVFPIMKKAQNSHIMHNQ